MFRGSGFRGSGFRGFGFRFYGLRFKFYDIYIYIYNINN